MQARLDRAIRQPGDLADLLDRQVLDIAQHDDLAMLLIQVRDRFLEQLLHLRSLQRMVGRIGDRRGDRAVDAVRRGGLGQLVALLIMTARAILDPVLAVIDCHPI